MVHQTEWRGPDAPPPPERSEAKVETHALVSQALGSERRIHVSLPDQPSEAILFVTDGQAPADLVRPLEKRGLIPPTAVIGVSNAQEGSIERNTEYCYGYGDPRRHAAHRKFFAGEVPEWLAETHGVRAARERTIVFGASSGGTFAAEIPILEPDKFGGVIALSAGMSPELEPHWGEYPAPSYGLGAGTLEVFQKTTQSLEARLRRAGVPTLFHEWVGGHDNERWGEALQILLPPLLEQTQSPQHT